MASNPVDARDLSGQARDLLPKGSYCIVGDTFTCTASVTGSVGSAVTCTFTVADGAITVIALS